VTASTLTSVAVFFPMVFISGVAGQLFKDQSLTVTFALAFSLVVALTLVPMLAAAVPTARFGSRERRSHATGTARRAGSIARSRGRSGRPPPRRLDRDGNAAGTEPDGAHHPIADGWAETRYPGRSAGRSRTPQDHRQRGGFLRVHDRDPRASPRHQLIPQMSQGEFNVDCGCRRVRRWSRPTGS